jgi:pimeloyl-ACP methyl ester carboxylesterase
VVCDDPDSLNAIDRIFHQRLKCGEAELAVTPLEQGSDASTEAAAAQENAGKAVFFLRAVHAVQQAASEARRQRISLVQQRLEKRDFIHNGYELTYCIGGPPGGPVLAIVNALGQPFQYWLRLLDRLMDRYRVITWETRGALSPVPLTIEDQASDLAAILHNENIDVCHLLGWCTGGKTAMAFALRQPGAVLSLLLLNCGFRCKTTPREYETDYERNLESLMQITCKYPEKAPMVMQLLQQTGAGKAQPVDEMDSRLRAINALASINLELRPYLLSPFQNEKSTLNYAHQALDFWSWDTLAHAGHLAMPVLVIGGEYDKIASPQMAKAIVPLFPNGRYVEVKGATHYSQYDHPDTITALITDFVEDATESKLACGSPAIDICKIRS